MRRALVVTVVHHPDDARIRYREIGALLDAEWRVTLAAPFAGHGLARPTGPVLLDTVDLPRAAGRRRVAALRSARELLRVRGVDHDVIVLHDPELLLTLPGLDLPPVVWDVHEDTAAAMKLKPWLPSLMRRPAATAIRAVETLAARRVHLILAEASYRDRFGDRHVVVPNTVRVPDRVAPPADSRIVYIGHVTLARGAADLVRVGQEVTRITRGETRLLVIGAADDVAQDLLAPAMSAGEIDWIGFVPSNEALPLLNGAMAGLSLLHDEPNYRGSLPTKVVEYMAHGVPVVSTPLPLARELVQRAGAGVIVPFGDPDAAVQEVLRLRADPARRVKMGEAGHRLALAEYDWRRLSGEFVNEIARIAATSTSMPTPG